MTNETEHVRFEVLVNGERRCVVGVEGFGVYSANVHWVLRDPHRKPKDRAVPLDEWSKEELELDVGGSRSSSDEHLRWLNEGLKVGDEVTIRVLGPGRFDLPPDAPSPP